MTVPPLRLLPATKPGGVPDTPPAIAFVVGGVVLAALVAPVAIVSVWYAIASLLTISLFAVACLKPHLAVYIFLFAAPLIVGVSRDSLLPVLRPNEALIVILTAALLTRLVAIKMGGKRLALSLYRFDVALVILALLGSVLPLAWMAARGMRPSVDDVLHALVFWKYVALYFVVRLSITSREQVRTCLWIVLSANAIVAIVGIVQSLRLFGVDRLMATYYPPVTIPLAAMNGRGTSTLGGSIAMGDVMAFSAAIALGLAIKGDKRRGRALLLAGLFALGAMASGQFSGVIALVVVVLTVGVLTGELSRLYVAMVVSVSTAGLVLAPVVSRRLRGFSADSGGVPTSWAGRLENLQTRVWPRVFSDFNFVFGVRPSPRILAWESWRTWIYIESGHTWLLWAGGIPLLIAFLYFSWVALVATARVARARSDAIGVAAIAACAGVVTVFVLTTLDMHLLLRGTADLLFPLFALSLLPIAERSRSLPSATEFLTRGGEHASSS